MSTVNNQHSESNFVQNDYNLGKIFIWNNRYESLTFLNNTGAAASFAPGLILAIKTDVNQLVPFDNSNTTLGQNIPVGILASDVPSIANNATSPNATYANQGDVVESRLVFQDAAGDNMDSVIAQNNARTVRQSLLAIGIKPIASRDLSLPDNS